jgi:hypothetical protein
MQTVSAHNFVIQEHKTEPFHKRQNESEVEAVQRIVNDHAFKGWELIETCGDEILRPVFVFRRIPVGEPAPQYLAKEVPAVKGQEEIQTVANYLWDMHDQGWLPVCVLNSPVSQPLAVFRRSLEPLDKVQIQLVAVAPEIFPMKTNSLVFELLDQQISRNLALQCVIHGGLYLILVLVSKEPDTNYQYLTDHANAGLFGNQCRSLEDLINKRNENGWEVCGAFEDSFLWPCLVFRRPTALPPVEPIAPDASD